MDNLNPTIEQIESLIPDSYRVACDLMGKDWCHPKQLRQLRDMTNIVIRRKRPETHPKEHAANEWLDEDASPEAFERWDALAWPWVLMLKKWKGDGPGAYAHLVYSVLDNLKRNWYYFEAPMIVWKEFGSETDIL